MSVPLGGGAGLVVESQVGFALRTVGPMAAPARMAKMGRTSRLNSIMPDGSAATLVAPEMPHRISRAAVALKIWARTILCLDECRNETFSRPRWYLSLPGANRIVTSGGRVRQPPRGRRQPGRYRRLPMCFVPGRNAFLLWAALFGCLSLVSTARAGEASARRSHRSSIVRPCSSRILICLAFDAMETSTG